MKGVLHPFLKVEENQFWSPLAVLEEQNITEERGERVEQGFIEVEEGSSDDPYRRWLMFKYRELMHLFLEAYKHNRGHTLSQFMDYLDEIGQSHIYEQRYFYDFWIIMHQRSPIQNGEMQEEEGNTLLGDALALLGTNILDVQEGQGVIQKYERFSIQEMIITVSEQ